LLAFLAFSQQAQAQVTNTNTNTITNGGTINSGTTALITNPVTSITGAITDNGLLLFQQSGLTITDAFVISGTGSLTMNGTGTLSLSASNAFAGTLQVNAGTLNFGSSGSISVPILYLGYNAGDAGIMQVGAGNTITISSNNPGLVIGNSGSGALYQSRGTINLNGGASGLAFPLGLNPGSYGFYQMSGGAASIPEIGVGSAGQNSVVGGNGVFQMTGGTFNCTSFFNITRSDSGTGQLGEVDLLGGVMNVNYFGMGQDFNGSSGKTSAVNFMGGTLNMTNSATSPSRPTSRSATTAPST
jgi:fibronectin-binding autotransporter adhesin